mmetsp:Transcript_7959/g.23985  ORF Transcript_7959/g.23985 Transcript_7959/m.23985 type:complete len:90 (-) Transcript_7959:219-488(-)
MWKAYDDRSSVTVAGLYKRREGDLRHPQLFRGVWNPHRRKLRMEKEYGTLPQPTGANAATSKGGAVEGVFFGTAMAGLFITGVQMLLSV